LADAMKVAAEDDRGAGFLVRDKADKAKVTAKGQKLREGVRKVGS
jgi:hypothetical protein